MIGGHTVPGVIHNERSLNLLVSPAQFLLRCAGVSTALLTVLVAQAVNRYVSVGGSNNNNGLSPGTAYATLQHASNQTVPGDTVFVMNGTYTATGAGSSVLAVASSGTPAAWIVYRNYPGHAPTIQLSAVNWNAIALNGQDHIVIDGFTVIGHRANITLAYAQAEQNNLLNPATSGNGIAMQSQWGNSANHCHHIIVRNCKVRDCCGGGIFSQDADHVSILNNEIFDCGWYSPYGTSGISVHRNWNSDTGTGIKMRIEGNVCAGNSNLVPFFYAGEITDGNGIIVDYSRNVLTDPLTAYTGRTYVANNVCYDNGGRGIHVFQSDHATVVNNTCYRNCRSPEIDDGEFTAYRAGDVVFLNNIAMPDPGVPPMDQSNTTLLTVANNLWGANSDLADPLGTNATTGDPLFKLASSDPAIADFHLLGNSPAIDVGSATDAPPTDHDGRARTVGSATDLGAFERQVVRVSVKALLEGPYESATALMRDDLRMASLIPLSEPYTALGFTQMGGGGEAVPSTVLSIAGNSAIVDWVFVELRSALDPTQVLSTRCALLQRDGDVVDKDGVSPVSFEQVAGNYLVSLRHRNHLGVMRGTAILLGASTTVIDFRMNTTATYGVESMKSAYGTRLLWTGNAFRDGLLLYSGSGNDRDMMLARIGGIVPTNTVTGYFPEDVSLDGLVRFTGSGNDRDRILSNIGGIIPTNTRTEQLP